MSIIVLLPSHSQIEMAIFYCTLTVNYAFIEKTLHFGLFKMYVQYKCKYLVTEI